MKAARDSQEGSVSVFTLGWIVVALMAVAVLVGATQVHLDRMGLVSLADELALAAAADATAQAYSAGATSITAQHAREAVAVGLARSGRTWAVEVALADVSVSGGDTVQVTLRRSVVPLVGDWGWLPGAAGVTITAQGSARVG